MKNLLLWKSRGHAVWWKLVMLLLLVSATSLKSQVIKTAQFQAGYQPREQIIQEIYNDIAQSIKGQFVLDEGVDSARNFMNHWFATDHFNKLVYATGFEFLAEDGPVDGPVWVWELHFHKDRDAIKALHWIDGWGLRNVQFFPPVNWFWIYFRGRILFMGCIRLEPFESAYKQVLDIVLQAVHKERVQGNQVALPQNR